MSPTDIGRHVHLRNTSLLFLETLMSIGTQSISFPWITKNPSQKLKGERKRVES